MFITALCTSGLSAQPSDDISKQYGIVSDYFPLPDKIQNNADKVIFYRLGWNEKKPYTVAIQFVNLGYADRKMKFALKDITTKKMLVLDKTHNSRFGTELLKSNSKGHIWASPIVDIKDGLLLRVWNNDGDEFDAAPVTIKDQK
jgi:hypothetical protein